jgi:hypothetical protein
MSTPIFDQLLREMARRTDRPPPAPPAEETPAEGSRTPARRRHRAE